MLRKSLIINPTDTVAMVLEDALKGDTIQTPQGQTVTLLSDVEFAHKVSILDQKKGDPVIKYGDEIGYLLEDTPAGSWIHTHNMDCDRGTK